MRRTTCIPGISSWTISTQAVCVTRFNQSESAIQTIASPKKKRVFALARVEIFVCVTAFVIGFWKLFSGGSLGKYSNIGSGSFFL